MRTIKSECLAKLILIGEPMLRRALSEFLAHYHHERTHQGLANGIIQSADLPMTSPGPVRKRERLGGLLSYNYGAPADRDWEEHRVVADDDARELGLTVRHESALTDEQTPGILRANDVRKPAAPQSSIRTLRNTDERMLCHVRAKGARTLQTPQSSIWTLPIQHAALRPALRRPHQPPQSLE